MNIKYIAYGYKCTVAGMFFAQSVLCPSTITTFVSSISQEKKNRKEVEANVDVPCVWQYIKKW